MGRKSCQLVILIFFLLFSFFFPNSFVYGQSPKSINLHSIQQSVPELIYHTSSATQKVNFISGVRETLPVSASLPIGSTSEDAARLFLTDYGSLFGIDDHNLQLPTSTIKTDNLSMQHVRFQQQHQGIPVFGGEIIVHLTSNLGTKAANGEILPSVDIDTTPDISAQKAVEIAKNLWQKQFGTQPLGTTTPQLLIFNASLLGAKDTKTHLVWKVGLSGQDTNGLPQAEHYFIDAHWGEAIYQITGLISVRNRLTYDCMYGNTCYLTYQETDNPTGSDDVSKLHRMTGETYNYYWNNHSRDSWDDSGATIIGLARADDMCNAYWNNITKDRIVFGPGLVVNDVVAHEFTHGVTDFSADLIYQRESGALNESYSDIFGTAVDNQDWEIGEDIHACIDGPIRDMSNPPRFGDPARFYDANTNLLCATSCFPNNDYCGVHYNSGVNNKAAYLIATGGSFNGCIISGIGRQKQEQIFYRALIFYLTSNSGFNSNYNALNQSCQDLIGTVDITEADCQEVSRALQAVEMDQPGPCSGISRQPATCAVSPTPTATLTPFFTPTATPTVAPTYTPTPTNSPIPTETPTPTFTPTPTRTPTPTSTPIPTSTPTPIPTNTPTPTTTPSLTPAKSPTPTSTNTPTVTPTKTPTPTTIPTTTPTSTPTPTSYFFPTPTVTLMPTITLTPTPILSPTPTPTAAPGYASLAFMIKFQGISTQKEDKTVKVTLKQNGFLRYTFNNVSVSSDETGIYTGIIRNIAPDIYDVYIKGFAHLQKKFASILLAKGENQQNLTHFELLAGDVNGDDKINAVDIGMVIEDYFPITPPETSADVNLDGKVNAIDIGFVIQNYLFSGEQ